MATVSGGETIDELSVETRRHGQRLQNRIDLPPQRLKRLMFMQKPLRCHSFLAGQSEQDREKILGFILMM